MATNSVKVISCDDKEFDVDVAVAKESQLLKNIIEAKCIDKPIHLFFVSGDVLVKVMEYCKYHVESRKTSNVKPATPQDEIKAWDANFVKVDQETLITINWAAEYMRIKNLQDLTDRTLVGVIGKTGEEIRKMYNFEI